MTNLNDARNQADNGLPVPDGSASRPDLDPNYKHLSSEDRDALWDDHQRQRPDAVPSNEPLRTYEAEYVVRSSMGPGALSEGTCIVQAADQDAAFDAARTWVYDNDAAVDPRVDPTVTIIDATEVDEPIDSEFMVVFRVAATGSDAAAHGTTVVSAADERAAFEAVHDAEVHANSVVIVKAAIELDRQGRCVNCGMEPTPDFSQGGRCRGCLDSFDSLLDVECEEAISNGVVDPVGDRPNVNVAFPNGRCNGCGNGLDKATGDCLNVECSQCASDIACAECGLPMELDSNDVSHHLYGGVMGDGFDADADHVAIADDSDWPECDVCGNDVHPNAVATYRPAITCEPCLDDVTCELCGNRNDDGEGYDGLCGNCADKHENDPVCGSCGESVGRNPFAVYGPAPVCQPCFDQQTCERCGNGHDGLCVNCADLYDDEPLEGHRRKRAAKAVQTITGLPLSSCYRFVDGTLPTNTIDGLDPERAFWATGVVAAYRSGQANARAVAYLLGCLTSGVVNVQFDHKATVVVSDRAVVLETAELNRPVIGGVETLIEGAHPTHFDALSAARTIADAL